MEFSTVIYINGVQHRCTGIGESFFADSASLPCRPCSQHRIGASAALALKNGFRVRTLGNWYSLQPDKEDPCTPSTSPSPPTTV